MGGKIGVEKHQWDFFVGKHLFSFPFLTSRLKGLLETGAVWTRGRGAIIIR